MRLQSKIALALLSLAIAVPASRAQDQEEHGPNAATPGIEQQGPPSDRGPEGKWQGRDDNGWRGAREWRDERGEGGWREGRGMGRREFARHRLSRLERLVNDPAVRERLGITPEQAAKIRQQITGFRIARIRSRADLQVKRVQLHELLAADTPDRAAIDRKLEEISAARLAQEKAAVDFRLAMRSALTPEQRQKLRQMREEIFHGRDGERGGPRGMRPPRPPQSAPPATNPPGEN